jgi:hypothetical protein
MLILGKLHMTAILSRLPLANMTVYRILDKATASLLNIEVSYTTTPLPQFSCLSLIVYHLKIPPTAGI